jgi:polar amino acid transport system permease protein
MSEFDFSGLIKYAPDFLAGARMTLELTAISLMIGLIVGSGLALARISGYKVLNWPAYAYTEFFRTTPPLVQIVWIYFVGPVLIGREINSFQAAAIALGLNIAAFFAEIFRTGLRGVAVTQRDAARMLGLSGIDTMRFVLVPQAIRIILPPAGTTVILLLKGTSLASAIGLLELTRIGQLVSTETFRPVEALTAVAVLYFILGYPIAYLTRRLETRLQTGQR